MIQEASFTGVLRMILVIIGIIVVLRFIGKLLMAKREMDRVNELERTNQSIAKEKAEAERRKGSISVSKNSSSHQNEIEDVDYQEV
jgi:uncharacterized membrane protein